MNSAAHVAIYEMPIVTMRIKLKCNELKNILYMNHSNACTHTHTHIHEHQIILSRVTIVSYRYCAYCDWRRTSSDHSNIDLMHVSLSPFLYPSSTVRSFHPVILFLTLSSSSFTRREQRSRFFCCFLILFASVYYMNKLLYDV